MGVVQQAGNEPSPNARYQSRPKEFFIQEGYIATSRTSASKEGRGVLGNGQTSLTTMMWSGCLARASARASEHRGDTSIPQFRASVFVSFATSAVTWRSKDRPTSRQASRAVSLPPTPKGEIGDAPREEKKNSPCGSPTRQTGRRTTCRPPPSRPAWCRCA